MNILLLMMGGKGTRFGADIPKQYMEVQGHPMFWYIAQKYSREIEIERIIFVSNKDWIPFVKEQVSNIQVKCEVVCGGETRSESVLRGLECAMLNGELDDVILIHDATHPYVDVEGTKKVIEILKNKEGATLAASQYDTIYETDKDSNIAKVMPRQNIVSGASPEAFHLGRIYRTYKNSGKEELERMTSAGAIALEHGIEMEAVPCNMLNLKITHTEDMNLFKHLFSYFFNGLDEK